MESGPRYGSELELHYFRIFCDNFAPAIAGPFASTLWKQLIPQASELEPFLQVHGEKVSGTAALVQQLRSG
jgi:hypothetical protein